MSRRRNASVASGSESPANDTSRDSAGEGEPGSGGGPSGDLYLTLHLRPHPFFTRHGADLGVEVPVSVPELLRGADIEVPTPDGAVQMKVPAGSQNGQRLRVRGKGATRRGSPEHGDLYVTLVATLPDLDAGDPRAEGVAREMEALYPERDLRAHLKEPT